MDLLCCFIGCEARATVEIRTIRSGGGIAGPDLYSDDTHSCDEHVGALLGWQPDCRDTDEILWEVRRLTSA